jgi:hypothetical protein
MPLGDICWEIPDHCGAILLQRSETLYNCITCYLIVYVIGGLRCAHQLNQENCQNRRSDSAQCNIDAILCSTEHYKIKIDGPKSSAPAHSLARRNIVNTRL